MNIIVFVAAVRIMRQAQKDYFRTRLPARLIEAKQMEQAVDKALADGRNLWVTDSLQRPAETKEE